MFDVIFVDLLTGEHFVVARGVGSLTSARELRKCSGDIVVHTGTQKPVGNYLWLWPWERMAGSSSYAFRQMQRGE